MSTQGPIRYKTNTRRHEASSDSRENLVIKSKGAAFYDPGHPY